MNLHFLDLELIKLLKQRQIYLVVSPHSHSKSHQYENNPVSPSCTGFLGCDEKLHLLMVEYSNTYYVCLLKLNTLRTFSFQFSMFHSSIHLSTDISNCLYSRHLSNLQFIGTEFAKPPILHLSWLLLCPGPCISSILDSSLPIALKASIQSTVFSHRKKPCPSY